MQNKKIHTSDDRCIGAAKRGFWQCVAVVEKTEGGHKNVCYFYQAVA